MFLQQKFYTNSYLKATLSNLKKAVIQIYSINAALSQYKAQSPKGATGNKYAHLCIIQKIYTYPTYITN
jgi:hypothetical protein